MSPAPPVVIVGAGIGGLAAALRLAHAGVDVTVLERHGAPGGKLRCVPSPYGPIDAGPTVLTLRHVFDSLFEDAGEALADHLTLLREPILARHYWPDGTMLDLHADAGRSAESIAQAFGSRAREDFLRFSARAKLLFEGFDAPMMQAARPTPAALTAHVMRNPRLLPAMAAHRTLAEMLHQSFREPRLIQLFGRYATYVGGSPYAAPALLGLIWHAEAQGVWRIAGGMHQLALAIESVARGRGAAFRYGAEVTGIDWQGGRPRHVRTRSENIPAGAVLFNGDPNALRAGALGETARQAVGDEGVAPRSLSANVMTFAARASGPALAHHTVFFADDPRAEFDALARGERPDAPSLYVCAQDRGGAVAPDGPERFEIIMNAAPRPGAHPSETEDIQCQTIIMDTLARFGLVFDPLPGPEALTSPAGFERLFPHSHGALYGRSPHGMMAAFARPLARTRLKGLYLAGGGTHPGAGLPMATLSGKHAAEAILSDLASTSRFRRTATPGGMSTGSARTARAPSRSSGS
ncbi:1-hydroxycarotenoid 3,4-desaturase CrtD [Roseovarius aquimarinus]|uniref:1-hydroxycarotenoid 3,4-desaturase CrtD n=1 Tax=Roseovarius aquimarinus TaxID=1229156 RepID=A0ABW7I2K8_9RHOB